MAVSSTEEELLSRLDRDALPNHVAVIMDGNRRWARSRRLPALLGHRAGVKAFRRMVSLCLDLGIEVLTAYAFSAENWKRSPVEVRVLMNLFEHYSRLERNKMVESGIKFQAIGRIDLLPPAVRSEFYRTEEVTRGNTRLQLNLAVNYGGRDELVKAVREIAHEVKAGNLSPDEISEQTISSHLWTSGLPDPDLLIRTSGELRVSNFLLWQMAYTEFCFIDLYWPDVTREVLLQALLDYQGRERRFGGGEVKCSVGKP